MGYDITCKKINMILNAEQQTAIYDIWTNPTQEQSKDNFALKVLPQVFRGEYFNPDEKCHDMKDLLNAIGFLYEETKAGLKIKSALQQKLRHQKDLFSCVAHLITPGSFMTFRGDDKEIIGFFFDGNTLIDYDSYEHLNELSGSNKELKNTRKHIK